MAALAGACLGAPTVLAQDQAGRSNRPTPIVRNSAGLEEVTVPADAVIGIRLDTTVTSARAKIEDQVSGRLTRDVTVSGRTAFPSGTRIEGFVTSVDRPTKTKEPARIGIRFTALLLGDEKTRLPIQTETIYRTWEPSSAQSATKIGAGAAVGAILGAIIGGKKGAVIGGAAGAAGGTAVAANQNTDVVIAAGTPLTVRLSEPVTVIIERLDGR